MEKNIADTCNLVDKNHPECVPSLFAELVGLPKQQYSTFDIFLESGIKQINGSGLSHALMTAVGLYTPKSADSLLTESYLTDMSIFAY